MDSLFSLRGRVIIVTGALGQLGRQFTAALLRHGANVAALDLAPCTDPSLGGLVSPEDGHNLLTIQADITRRSEVEKALETIMARWEVPHGLVNSAALDSPPDAPASENGPFETYPEASLERMIAVNILGTVYCCQVFGGAMAREGRGSIVNVGSIYGIVSPDQSLYEYRREAGDVFFKPVGYSLTKSALYNLTRYLAAYWGKSGVRINILTPAGVFNRQDPRFLERYTPKVPLGRMADPPDYNGTIIYLLSDASAYMTGSNVVVDGGFTAL
jgi:NAD(P)-dependent dehydrogenase (short-subunit alcohol dehydrogenase family)